MKDKSLKLVVFDLDGTLVDAFKAVTLSLNHAFKQCDLPRIDEVLVTKSVGWGEKVLVEKLVPKDKVKKVLRLYRAHHAHALTKGVKFLPGAKRLLAKLQREGYQLAIASNRPSRFTKIILRTLNVSHLFSMVLCADQVTRAKPSGMMLRLIMRKLKCKKSEALYVGDMAIDAQAANDASIPVVTVTTGSHTVKELRKEKPLKIISHLKDLDPIIAKLSR